MNRGVSLRLYDGDGQTPRVNLGIAPQGPGMVTFGPDGRLPRVVLGTTPTGDNPGMASFDASGTARLVVGPTANGAGTMVFDSKGQLGVLDGVREGDIPGVTVYYPDGKTPHLQLEATPMGDSGGLAVHDRSGQLIAQFP
ncbi:MAG: hypothetical protein ACR2PL_26295 [Dehalococcoidia bacterium]